MRYYRGLFLLAAFLLVLATLSLRPGEAQNTECACSAGADQGRLDQVQKNNLKCHSTQLAQLH